MNEVRRHIPNVRVDANGGWSVDEAITALRAITDDGELEYAEQPCASVEELVRVRAAGGPVCGSLPTRAFAVPRTRCASYERGGADVAVVKVPPLGGMRAVVALSAQLADYGVPVVVSSALDTAVGMSAGLAAAAALPTFRLPADSVPAACSSGMSRSPGAAVDGALSVGAVEPDPVLLETLAAPADRRDWWLERARRCHRILGSRDQPNFV